MIFPKWLAEKPLNRVGVKILRVGLGSVIALRAITELPYAHYLYSTGGASMGSTSLWLGQLGLQLDRLIYSSIGAYLLLIIWGLGGLGLVLDLYPRLSTLVALLGTLLIELRSNTGDGGDNLLRILLTYMLLLHPKPELARGPSLSIFLHNLGVIAIYFQISLLYLVSSTTKLQGDAWVHGTAVYYVTQLESYGPPWPFAKAVFLNPWATTLATYLVVFYQLFFAPIALIAPLPLKLAWLLMGIALHASFAVMMGLITFSAVMVSAILFTIRDREWGILKERAEKIRRFLLPEIWVFVDGFCPYCKRTGTWIERLDWLGLFRVKSYREDRSFEEFGLEFDQVDKEMHIIVIKRGKYKVYKGFQALLEISKYILFLWPLLPVLGLLNGLGLGPRLYRWLADNRIIVPSGKMCEEGSCKVQKR
jgi:predicted DCC family thiol-disulfide oxidoreductase YuxK